VTGESAAAPEDIESIDVSNRAERMTWKRVSAMFFAGLRVSTCGDHGELMPGCPYCRDTAAVRLSQDKAAGRSALSWQEVAMVLAERFQYFPDCVAHTVATADVLNCPFCRAEEAWRRYVQFCSRRGVASVIRDVDVRQENAVTVSIFELYSHDENPDCTG
jgi:hypothetical protein